MVNCNFSPLPIYNDLREQDFRKPWAHGSIYPLWARSDVVLPFYYNFTDTRERYVTGVYIYKLTSCGEEQIPTNFRSIFEYNGLAVAEIIESADAPVVLYYPANAIEDLALDKGQYYLRITTSLDESLYSEVFTVLDDDELERQALRLSWGNISNLYYRGGVTPFELGYTNWLYLDTEVGMPEYTFESEGVRRDGYFRPIKQLSGKTYKMVFYAPEYLCDALRLVRLADSIYIVNRGVSPDDGSRILRPTSFLMEASWLEHGHYAKVECEFTTNTIIKKVGRNVNVLE